MVLTRSILNSSARFQFLQSGGIGRFGRLTHIKYNWVLATNNTKQTGRGRRPNGHIVFFAKKRIIRKGRTEKKMNIYKQDRQFTIKMTLNAKQTKEIKDLLRQKIDDILLHLKV